MRKSSTTRKYGFPSSAGMQMEFSDEHCEKAFPLISDNDEPDSNDRAESEEHP
jgi:hypothetical protein